jgi:hypothetical protein
MSMLLSGFHPSFDALSAHADLSDIDSSRTRVGRHVARCARCADLVEDIRGLGDSARASVMPGAPAGLWPRIEVALNEPSSFAGATHGLADAAEARSISGPLPIAHGGTSSYRSVARIGVGLSIAAGTALAAVLLATGPRRDLRASPPSRLTLEQEYVVPGSDVRMRYRPSPALADLQAVTVWAAYTRESDSLTRYPGDALTRAGTLRRSSSQEFVGSVTLPAGVLFASYLVGDSLGNILDRERDRSRYSASVLAGTSSGSPTFEAMVAFLGAASSGTSRDARRRVAAQLERSYPDRPETWLLTYSVRSPGPLGDIVKIFESHERKYLSWHEKLKGRQGLSLQTEVMMANMAQEVDTAALAQFWTERVIRDHPRSPFAAERWIWRFRYVPRDSASLVLSAFEPIWKSAVGLPPRSRTAALALAERSGDPVLVRRWRVRAAEASALWTIDAWLLDPPLRVELASIIREQLARELRDTVGTPTLWGTARLSTEMHFFRRQLLETRLAAIQLLDGDALGARHVLDSLVTVAEARGECINPATSRWHAEAARRLGDLKSAQDDYAYLATTENWQIAVVGDSAPRFLGPAYSADEWARAKAAAAVRHRECFAASRDRRKGMQ